MQTEHPPEELEAVAHLGRRVWRCAKHVYFTLDSVRVGVFCGPEASPCHRGNTNGLHHYLPTG